VQGRWKGVIDGLPGDASRRRIGLEFERHFQILTGRAWVGGGSAAGGSDAKCVPIGDGRIRGHAVHFRLPAIVAGRSATCHGIMEGPHLRGTWEIDAETTGVWGASRE
jgi:hypothetical protein